MIERLPDTERFWVKVEKRDDGCWAWTGELFRNGYGCVYVYQRGERRRYLTHRVAYLYQHDSIPEGLDLDHLCRNRACCNPAHLEPVTRRVNLMRGETLVRANARKTHCRNGHPLEGDNLCRDFLKTGRRVCATCRRESKRLREQRPDVRERKLAYMREWHRKNYKSRAKA